MILRSVLWAFGPAVPWSDDQKKKKKSEVDVYVQHVQNRNLVKTFQVELSVLHLLRKHLTDPSQNGQGPR